MWNNLQLYFRYVGISLRTQMQYKASFIMMSLGDVVISGLEFFAIWALFDRFKNLQGWTFPEAALIYGIVNCAFQINELTSRGFDKFAGMVKSGDFDRLLLRPRSTVLQLIGQELMIMRLGRFTQALVILIWAMHNLGIDWTLARLGLLTGSILGGACLFYGIIIMQATMCFWTIESLEIFNTITYGGVETAQYPLSIYRRWMRNFFTFLVPLACINYFPTLAILGRTSGQGIMGLLVWFAPCVGVLFLILSLQVWKIGIRHYCSTGS